VLDLELDDPHPDLGHLWPVDPGTDPSGVTELRAWFGAEPGDAPWIVPQERLALRLPDGNLATLVSIQVRDGAGNESVPERVVLRRPAATAVDRAVILEERAEDRAAAGDLGGARSIIGDSILHVKESLHRLLTLDPPPTPAERKAAKTLARVLGLKALAKAQMRPRTASHALATLRKAIDLEVALAESAAAAGLRL
jgi:hypothetical protein